MSCDILVWWFFRQNIQLYNLKLRESCWDYHIHPRYKNNTNEVMSLFLKHCWEYQKKRKLCRLLWVGNHQNQILSMRSIQITVTHLMGYWETDWGNVTCVQGMYIHYSITFNAHKHHKGLKDLSHDSRDSTLLSGQRKH